MLHMYKEFFFFSGGYQKQNRLHASDQSRFSLTNQHGAGALRACREVSGSQKTCLELMRHFAMHQDPEIGKDCADNYQVASIPRNN